MRGVVKQREEKEGENTTKSTKKQYHDWDLQKKNKPEGILLKDPELTPSKDIRDCQNEESPMSY